MRYLEVNLSKTRNKFKRKAIKDYGEIFSSKGVSFEETWKNAMSLARKIYTKKDKSTRANKTFSEIAAKFVSDKANYPDSILEKFERATGNSIEKYSTATFEIYDERMKKFLNSHGDETFTYDGKTKTINEFFEDFKNTKGLEEDKQYFNDLIEEFKKNPNYVKEAPTYKYRHNRSYSNR